MSAWTVERAKSYIFLDVTPTSAPSYRERRTLAQPVGQVSVAVVLPAPTMRVIKALPEAAITSFPQLGLQTSASDTTASTSMRTARISTSHSETSLAFPTQMLAI